MSVKFVYLDEFGHIGPFMSRNAKKYNESPVFGLAGIILPEDEIRPFATRFLQLKQHVFASEIKRSGKLPQEWEKHGSEIFTPKLVARYPHFRSTGFRLLNYIRDCGGKAFYYGREKIYGTTNVNSTGLYTTVLGHAIRQLESFCQTDRTNFVMVVDEHSARKQLLVTASKTMYGHTPRAICCARHSRLRVTSIRTSRLLIGLPPSWGGSVRMRSCRPNTAITTSSILISGSG
jgi:hypothetical protein